MHPRPIVPLRAAPTVAPRILIALVCFAVGLAGPLARIATPLPIQAQSADNPLGASAQPVGQVGGVTRAIVPDGDRLWMGIGPRVAAVDVADASQPRVIGRSPWLDGVVYDIAVDGSGGTSGGAGSATTGVATTAGPTLYTLDLTDPTAPAIAGSVNIGDALRDVALAEGFAYVIRQLATADQYGQRRVTRSDVAVVDVRDPAAPVVVSQSLLPADRYAAELVVAGRSLAVSVAADPNANFEDRHYELRLFDLTDPASPRHVNTQVDQAWFHLCNGQGSDRAHVVFGMGLGTIGLDVRDPARPAVIVRYLPDGESAAVFVDQAVIAAGVDRRVFFARPGGFNDGIVGAVPPSGGAGSLSYAYVTWISGNPAGGFALAGRYLAVSGPGGRTSVLDIGRWKPDQPDQNLLAGTLDTLGTAVDVATGRGSDAGTLFASSHQGGLGSFDLAVPDDPRPLGFAFDGGYHGGLAVDDGLAVLGYGGSGDMLEGKYDVYSVRDRTAPLRHARIQAQSSLASALAGDQLYAKTSRDDSAWSGNVLRRFDLANPSAPTPTWSREVNGSLVDLDVEDDRLVLARYDSDRPSTAASPMMRLELYRLAGPGGALQITDADFGAPSGYASGLPQVDLDGDNAYIVVPEGKSYATQRFHLYIVNLEDPLQPRKLASLPLAGFPISLLVRDGHAFIHEGCPRRGDTCSVEIVDVRDPAAPVVAGRLPGGAIGQSLGLSGNVNSVAVEHGLVYVATGASGIYVYRPNLDWSPKVNVPTLTPRAFLPWAGATPSRFNARSLRSGVGGIVPRASKLPSPAARERAFTSRLEVQQGHVVSEGQAAASEGADALALTARTGGHLGAVIADGTTAYASYDFRVHTYDFGDPAAPKRVASRPQVNGIPGLLPGNLARMARRGEWTYGLVDWDRPPPIDQDSHLIFVVLDQWQNVAGTLELPGFTHTHGWQPQALELAVLGDHHVLVADTGAEGHRLRVIDVAQPAKPALVGSFAPDALPRGLAVAGSFAYLLEADDQNDVRQIAVLDLSDATAPRLAARFPTVERASDIVVGDGHAFVVGCGGLEVYSLADPAQPRLVATRPALGPMTPPATPGAGPSPTPPPPAGGIECSSGINLEWRDGLLYAVGLEMVDPFGFDADSILWVFDVSRPEQPGLQSLTRWSGSTGRLAVGDGFAVAGNSVEGMRAVDLSHPQRPQPGEVFVGGRMIVEALAAAPGLVVQNAAFGFDSELQFIVPGKGIVGRLKFAGLELVRDLAIQDGLVYAVVDADKLLVVDARGPALTAPRVLATIPAIADMAAVAPAGDRVYVAEADTEDGSARGGLRVLDLRDPGHLVELGRAPGSFLSLAVAGGHVFAGSSNAPEIRAFTAGTAPGAAALTPAGSVTLEQPVRDLVAERERLYALDEGSNVLVVDAADPRQPRLLGQLALRVVGDDNSFVFGPAIGLAVRGDVVYAGSCFALQTIDASDPAAPRRVAIRAIPSHLMIEHGPVDFIPTGGQVAAAGWDVYIAGDMTGLWTFGAGTLEGRTEVFEGLYWANFEHSELVPARACANDAATWYLRLDRNSDFERRYRALYPDYDRCCPHVSGHAWVRFEGRVTPPSPTGFLWFLEREVTVTRVLDMWKVPGCAFAPRPWEARSYLPVGWKGEGGDP